MKEKTLTLMAVHAHPDDEAIGTGGILAKRELELKAGDTIETISERNYYFNKWQTLVDTLLELRDGIVQPLPQQPEEQCRYCPE